MDVLLTVLLLILMAASSSIIQTFIPIKTPLPILQIVIGCAVALIGFEVELRPDLFLILFIPPLLFEDARKMPIYEFVRSGREILSLALTLVFITVIGLGFLIHWILPEMPIYVAIALAAVLSPTDAVALSGIVGKGRLSKKMMRILEGEALMNDASALVSLKFAILAAIGTISIATTKDVATIGLDFLKLSVGGLIIGAGATWIYLKLVQLFSKTKDDDPAVQTIFLMLVPFFIYVIAEEAGVSGILAAVASGMLVGHSGLMTRAPIQMRFRANSAWSLLEYVLNGVVFILLGLQIPGIIEYSMERANAEVTINFMTLFVDVFWIYAFLMLLRFSWLLTMKLFSQFVFKRFPMQFRDFSVRELLILTFSGVRGAVTLAAALSIPLIIATRYQVIFLAAGVIILSLIVGVIILPILLKGFTLDLAFQVEEETKAKELMTVAATHGVQTLQERLCNNTESEEEQQHIKQVVGQVLHEVERYNGQTDYSPEAQELELRIRLTALQSQRGEVYRLKAAKAISLETADKLIYEIDLAETWLQGKRRKREKPSH